jgi:phenylalanyl-tRNA synthetase alpha chain
MEKLTNSIHTLKTDFIAALAVSNSTESLDAVRVTFLGRNGRVSELMETLKTLSTDEKRTAGPALNELKRSLEDAFTDKKTTLEKQALTAALEKKRSFDVTASLPDALPAKLHIYTQVITQLEDIFSSMGFSIIDGPEIETDFHNFQALNIPADHPARDMQDTFWLTNPGMLVRTHTSTMQIRAMQHKGAPLAVAGSGRVYRNEATDASHDYMFTQFEALYVAENVSIANLMATAQQFLQTFFGSDKLKIRVRPGFFPFVEPGLEIDGTCPFCTKGCAVCKYSTWIELMGAGLVHPNVLTQSGIDAKKYNGFALGCGIERLAVIKHGINDIRLFHSNQVEVLDQF